MASNNSPSVTEPSACSIIVYTVIFGNYDNLPQIIPDKDGIEYYCFTDSDIKDTKGWKCVYTPSFFKDSKLTTGYIKANPHLLFPWNTIAVWIDSNIDQIEFTKSKILYLLQDNPIAALPHRFRKTIFGEAAVVAEYNLDNRNKISKWEQELLALGYPDDQGLSELGFFIRDLRQSKVRNANSTWWKYIINGSRRDQLSFNLSLWLSGLNWYPIKVNTGDSAKAERFSFSFKEHSHSIKRTINNNTPALDSSEYAPYCWTELKPTTNQSGESETYFLYAQEFWLPELLRDLRMLNEVLQNNRAIIKDNYCFLEKETIQKHSVPDIRLSWKREYLRKSILPSKRGIEIGFGHGHSAAIMLSYNPNVLIAAIETTFDQTMVLCGNKLTSSHPNRLDISFDDSNEAISEFLRKHTPEKIEFIHYNSPKLFSPKEFWDMTEWYLCNAPIGCRLILSDMKKDISTIINIIHSFVLVEYSDPGIPAAGGNRQVIKTSHANQEQLKEIKSLYTATTDYSEMEIKNARIRNTSLIKENNELLLENTSLHEKNISLQKEILSHQQTIKELLQYSAELKKPISFIMKKIVRKLKKTLK